MHVSETKVETHTMFTTENKTSTTHYIMATPLPSPVIPEDWWQLATLRVLGDREGAESLLQRQPCYKTTQYGSTVVEEGTSSSSSSLLKKNIMYWKKDEEQDTGMDLRLNTEELSLDQMHAMVHDMVHDAMHSITKLAAQLVARGSVRTVYHRVREYSMFIRVQEFVFITTEADKCFIVSIHHGVDPTDSHDQEQQQQQQEQAEEEEEEEEPPSSFFAKVAGLFGKLQARLQRGTANCEEDCDYEWCTNYGDEDDIYEFSNFDDLHAYMDIQFKSIGGMDSLVRHFDWSFGEKDCPEDNLAWLAQKIAPVTLGNNKCVVLNCAGFRQAIKAECAMQEFLCTPSL